MSRRKFISNDTVSATIWLAKQQNRKKMKTRASTRAAMTATPSLPQPSWRQLLTKSIHSANYNDALCLQQELKNLYNQATVRVKKLEEHKERAGPKDKGIDPIEWFGGNTIPPKGGYGGGSCAICDDDNCGSQCTRTCEFCDAAWICEDHIKACHSCGKNCCDRCLGECEQCAEPVGVCSGCMDSMMHCGYGRTCCQTCYEDRFSC